MMMCLVILQTPDETWEEIATAVAPRMRSVARLEFPRISCAVMNKVGVKTLINSVLQSLTGISIESLERIY